MWLHKAVLDYDLPKCLKKRWYPTLDKELSRILKLLDIDKALPGEYQMRCFKGQLSGKILHACINLPKISLSRREGARIIYSSCHQGIPDLCILYLGGHKDSNYNNEKVIVSVVTTRLKDAKEMYINYETYKKSLG